MTALRLTPPSPRVDSCPDAAAWAAAWNQFVRPGDTVFLRRRPACHAMGVVAGLARVIRKQPVVRIELQAGTIRLDVQLSALSHRCDAHIARTVTQAQTTERRKS